MDVTPRILGFPQHTIVPVGLLRPAQTLGDMHVESLPPPGPGRDALLDSLMEDLNIKAAKLDNLSAETRELVVRHDPVQLIPSIAISATMGFVDLEAADDAPHTFSTAAKIEYLTGLALSAPPGSAAVDEQTTARAMRLISEVCAAAQARLLIDSSTGSEQVQPWFGHTHFLLRFEHLLDRMAGYEVHLEEIADAIFESHRDLYCKELGFCPSDVVRLARRHNLWFNDRLRHARSSFFAGIYDEDTATECDAQFRAVLESTCLWNSELLSHTTNLPIERVAAILSHMSTDFGCQPKFRTPFDDNRARYYPIVRLPSAATSQSTPWPSSAPSAIPSPQPSSRPATNTEAQPQSPPLHGTPPCRYSKS